PRVAEPLDGLGGAHDVVGADLDARGEGPVERGEAGAGEGRAPLRAGALPVDDLVRGDGGGARSLDVGGPLVGDDLVPGGVEAERGEHVAELLDRVRAAR